MLASLALAAILSAPGDFRIDPAGAQAGFELGATMHTVHGLTASVAGEIHAEPAADGSLKLTGKIEIGTASLRTGNDKRDATMHDKSLLVASFPSIVLEPETFTPSGPAAADGAVSGTLTGRLTIRGQTKPQTIALTLTPQGGRIAAAGTFDVVWAEFGIPDPSFFVVRIERKAHAHFHADFVSVR